MPLNSFVERQLRGCEIAIDVAHNGSDPEIRDDEQRSFAWRLAGRVTRATAAPLKPVVGTVTGIQRQ